MSALTNKHFLARKKPPLNKQNLRFYYWISKLARRVKEELGTLQRQSATPDRSRLSRVVDTVELLICSLDLYRKFDGSWEDVERETALAEDSGFAEDAAGCSSPELKAEPEDDLFIDWCSDPISQPSQSASSDSKASTGSSLAASAIRLASKTPVRKPSAEKGPTRATPTSYSRPSAFRSSASVTHSPPKTTATPTSDASPDIPSPETTPSLLICDLCGGLFETKKELDGHRKAEHDTTEEQEEENDLLGRSLEELREGEIGGKKKTQCKFCGKWCQEIEAHTRRMHGQVQRERVKCDLCEKTFVCKQGLQRHRQFMHNIKSKKKKKGEEESEETYECCGRIFKHKASYMSHKGRLHNKDPNKPEYYKKLMLICPHCGEERSGRYGLKKHIENVHERKKAVKCPICFKEFAKGCRLEEHIDAVHRKLKKYPCKTCGNFFSTPRNRDAHVKQVHLNIRNFKCDYCPSAFIRRSQLEQHVKSAHLMLGVQDNILPLIVGPDIQDDSEI